MTALTIFTLAYTYFPTSIPVAASQDTISMAYTTSLFQEDTILTLDIQMEEEQWADMLENAMSETWYPCNITVNGVTYKNVGIRPKGNTSLSQVASDDTTDRYSFKVKFDYYIKGQTCDGLDCLILNNLISDATYMKEYFSYDMFQFMGVPSSLFSFASISLNEEAWGLYLALEAPEVSFLKRNYGADYGQLYKPESSRLEGIENKRTDSGLSESNNSNLSYLGNDASAYSYIFDNAILSPSESDKVAVIKALKNISEGNLENSLDIDTLLRYMAVNVFLVNLDSYFGSMLHNYLLYEENGCLSMLPWDYNLAFAGFQSGLASDSVNLAIDSVVSNTALEERPLLFQVMQVPEYQEKYHSYLEHLVSKYFENGYFEAKLAKTDALITSYVSSDPTAFYTHEEYQTALTALKTFCKLRTESIRGQLNGSIPSTQEAQSAEKDSLVDTGSLNLSDMGAQGGPPQNQSKDFQPSRYDLPAGNFSPPKSSEIKHAPPVQNDANAQNTAALLLYSFCLAATAAGLLFARYYPRRRPPVNNPKH